MEKGSNFANLIIQKLNKGHWHNKKLKGNNIPIKRVNYPMELPKSKDGKNNKSLQIVITT